MTTKKTTKALPARLKKYQTIAEDISNFANVNQEKITFLDYAALEIIGIDIKPLSLNGKPLVSVSIPQIAFDRLSRIYWAQVNPANFYRLPVIQTTAAGCDIFIYPPANANEKLTTHGLTTYSLEGIYLDLANQIRNARIAPGEVEVDPSLLEAIHELSFHVQRVWMVD